MTNYIRKTLLLIATLLINISLITGCGGGGGGNNNGNDGGGGSGGGGTHSAKLIYCLDNMCSNRINSISLNTNLNESTNTTIFVKNIGNSSTGTMTGRFSTTSITDLNIINNNCAYSLESNNTCSFTINYAPIKNELGSLSYTITPTNGDSINLLINYSANSSTNNSFVMAYYPNYSGYFNNNSYVPASNLYGHYIAEPSYVIPGISASYPQYFNGQEIDNKQLTSNDDLKNKLQGLDALTYSFFTVNTNGAIQFSDPWADLGNTTEANELYHLPLGSSIISVKSGTNFSDNVHFDGFGAFMKLSKLPNTGYLNKFISIGGWQGTSWDQNLASTQQLNTFESSIEELYSIYKIDGIDFDVENNGFSTITFTNYIQNQLMQIITNLKNSLPNIKITLTIQADPSIISAIGNTLQQNQNKIFAINLMTYDFNGAFTPSGVTGFNSNLFIESGDTTLGQFSVDGAVKSLEQYIPASMINIGLPAYGRAAISQVSNTNQGLFQNYSSTTGSIVLPGDLDSTNCTSQLGSSNTCSGTFDYNYIIQRMLNNGFTQTNWLQNGYNNGTTAFASNWTVQTGISINGIDSVGIANSYPGTTFNNVFIAYISGQVAHDYGKYVATNKLKGAILWTIMGDAPYTDTKNSLIYNFNQGVSGK